MQKMTIVFCLFLLITLISSCASAKKENVSNMVCSISEDSNDIVCASALPDTQMSSLVVPVAPVVSSQDAYRAILTSTGSAVIVDNGASIEGTIVEKNEEIARVYIIQAPTYAYDGVEKSIQLLSSKPLRSFDVWEFVYCFETMHAGYGDRKEDALPKTLTQHVARVVVSSGAVVAAIFDNTWDELMQRELSVQIEVERYTKENKEIQVAPGSQFIIALPANPTTGFTWEPEISEGSNTVVGIEGTRFEIAEPEVGLVGAGGKQIWQFRAVEKGSTTVTFTYKRLWETKKKKKTEDAERIEKTEEEIKLEEEEIQKNTHIVTILVDESVMFMDAKDGEIEQ